MKKKYRRAVCYSIGGLWLTIISPIMVLGIIGEYCALLTNWLCDIFPDDWLKTKLRVYDEDPDFTPKNEKT